MEINITGLGGFMRRACKIRSGISYNLLETLNTQYYKNIDSTAALKKFILLSDEEKIQLIFNIVFQVLISDPLSEIGSYNDERRSCWPIEGVLPISSVKETFKDIFPDEDEGWYSIFVYIFETWLSL